MSTMCTCCSAHGHEAARAGETRIAGPARSKFICAYKSASSRLLKKEFHEIRRKLWKEYFWSRSFCLLTTGGAPIEVIRRYIESQGQK